MFKRKFISSKNQRLLKGFTVIELLVGIVVITILILVALAAIAPGKAKARDARRITEVNTIRKAIQMYYIDHAKYPEQEDTWCSIESDCTNLVNEIAPYLPEIPEDPFFGKGKEPAGELYSYQYITTNGGQEYKLHADLETGDNPHEVYSMGGSVIAYVPPGGGNGNGNGNGGDSCISKLTDFEFDPVYTYDPYSIQIDPTHYLMVYQGPGSHGYSTILEIDGNYNISTSSANFKFTDEQTAEWPTVTQIDNDHYLATFSGGTYGAFAVILKVDTATWVISTSSVAFEFDDDAFEDWPEISQINQNHYLITYGQFDVQAIVLEVNMTTWEISTPVNTSFVIDSGFQIVTNNPDVSRINEGHHLVTYYWQTNFAPPAPPHMGRVALLEVDTATWELSTTSILSFEPNIGSNAPLYQAHSKIDNNHYFVTYRGPGFGGWAIVLEVNTATWVVSTSSSPFRFHPFLYYSGDISQTSDSYHYLALYRTNRGGFALALEVDASTWVISTSSAVFEYEPDAGIAPAISQIDGSHYLVSYQGPDDDGWAVVLEVDTCP